MQPIATIIMDLHLDLVMTYALEKTPVGITTVVIPSVPLTVAVTVAATSLQEAEISVPVM